MPRASHASNAAAELPDGASTPPLESQVASVIANQIRQRRQQLGLSVEKLAERCELSKGMLSKLENAGVSPSLATLVKLAEALEMPFTNLFRGLSEEHEAVFVKAGHAPEVVRRGTRAGHIYHLLGSPRPPFDVAQPLLVTLTERSEVFPLFQHAGVEVLFMLRGVMEYEHGGSHYRMTAGDTLQFEGSISHGPSRLLRLPIQFLSITIQLPM